MECLCYGSLKYNVQYLVQLLMGPEENETT